MSFEAVELKDQNWGSSVNLDSLGGFYMLLADATVPLVTLAQLLSLLHHLKTVIDGHVLVLLPFTVFLLHPRMVFIVL